MDLNNNISINKIPTIFVYYTCSGKKNFYLKELKKRFLLAVKIKVQKKLADYCYLFTLKFKSYLITNIITILEVAN